MMIFFEREQPKFGGVHAPHLPPRGREEAKGGFIMVRASSSGPPVVRQGGAW